MMNQISFFESYTEIEEKNCYHASRYSTARISIPDDFKNKLKVYNLDLYLSDVETFGLEKTWDYICQYVMDNLVLPDFLKLDNLGELYEIGLAMQDKNKKKKNGQYYTPDDVAAVMSKWLEKCEGEAVCDVGCGTGKLIVTYLNLIGYDAARELILSGNLYLYDMDNVALKICRTILAVRYGLDIADSIHDVFGDFLNPNIVLPDNCKVISNPPYAHIDALQSDWEMTDILLETKEFYAVFMEKIFKQAKSTVIITPFSFVSGNKFYSLRKKMSEIGNGFVVSFDNVPGNIFCGRKHGIFNTNTANSVRASITVLRQSDEQKGLRISPLIRFKTEERNRLLDNAVLENTIPDDYQVADSAHQQFEKVDKDLYRLFADWRERSNLTVGDILSKTPTDYFIDMPNTCRYFTTASSKKLNRTGSITMYVKSKREFNFLYCFINSSFVYWWWRIYDGGITYPKSLFYKIPLPIRCLTEEDDAFFDGMTQKLISEEKNFIVTKVNAGAVQENIKYPEEYRKIINQKILDILHTNTDVETLDKVHSNSYFSQNDCNLRVGGIRMNVTPLTNRQKEIMKEFYAVPATKVVYNKRQRDMLWKQATARTNGVNLDELEHKCPALAHQIARSYDSGHNIQPAVFSECVYAQTIANMFQLDVFVNCFEDASQIPSRVQALLKSYHLSPRYMYTTSDKRRMLIQAGGCDGIDSALVNVSDLEIYTIEFKEPGAKTSEPDLPKYGEDGVLCVNDDWLSKNGQFEKMLDEQKGLNFFEVMGHNVNCFSKESIMCAVSNNYTNKLLDVICTEDVDGYLTMMPANQVHLWADIEGEIRPAGRNHYKVWTPMALKNFLLDKKAIITGDIVTIEKTQLEVRKARGGDGQISGYKITPLFFVYLEHCEDNGGSVIFHINHVRQLNPTITGKVFFKKLKHNEVKTHYGV